jgi:hypothetical protein
MKIQREKPLLCKNCQQWLCADKDLFCAYCGAALVAINFSPDRLVFSDIKQANPLSLTITNQGMFLLYWAAEVIAPEPGIERLFSLVPDYGIIAPGRQQAINVSLIPIQQPMTIRAQLEIASNAPHHLEVRIPLTLRPENA